MHMPPRALRVAAQARELADHARHHRLVTGIRDAHGGDEARQILPPTGHEHDRQPCDARRLGVAIRDARPPPCFLPLLGETPAGIEVVGVVREGDEFQVEQVVEAELQVVVPGAFQDAGASERRRRGGGPPQEGLRDQQAEVPRAIGEGLRHLPSPERDRPTDVPGRGEVEDERPAHVVHR